MKTFDLKSSYSQDVYTNCYFVIGNYSYGGGTYLGIESLDEGPIADVSINIDATCLIGNNTIYTKLYDGIDKIAQQLVDMGFLTKSDMPIAEQDWGKYVAYNLTDKIKDYISEDSLEAYELAMGGK